MPLTDVFRINMPYGLMVNPKGEVAFFNREYAPLGSKHDDSGRRDYTKWEYVKYNRITDRLLIELDCRNMIQEQGDGYKSITFYDDGSNPLNQKLSSKVASDMAFDEYFTRLKKILVKGRKYLEFGGFADEYE